ncbi:AAA family ATPase, partial [Salmonella enterica subsp. enterica serovar Newport]|nr:AAA family ATPase [Salmonella enterica subsp. enterica serovar Newport]
MLRINKLYSMPESFEPVSFYSGINLILGEKDDTSNKTNGVGKTLLIEFINFCLLKEFKSSRVSKIPHSDFSKDILICLDFNIGDINIISQRSIGKHNEPTLIINGKTIEFSGVDDALSHLSNLTFKNSKVFLHPSFRTMLGPLIRDERSEFKSIVECFDTKLHIPADYTPHLYLLGIDISPYKEAKILQREIDDLSTTKNKIKKDIEFLTGSKISSAKAEVNDLKSKVEHIKKAMDALDSDSSYEMIKDEVAELESSLEELRNKRTILKLELSRINSLVGDVYINDEEVIEVYNKFKVGLGDAIKKELDDVISFKKKIDHFQHTLLNTR